MLEPQISTHGKSDYGFYGKTGDFIHHNLPVKDCSCGGKGILMCEYDDTPGYRETVYQMKCDDCKIETVGTCIIDNVLNDWDKKVEDQQRTPTRCNHT